MTVEVVEVIVEPTEVVQVVVDETEVVEVLVVGPMGPQGPPGAPGGAGVGIEYPITTPSASWSVVVPVFFGGRRPNVQVYLADGSVALADVFSDASNVNVTFASPTTGWVVLT